jgi:Recombinase
MIGRMLRNECYIGNLIYNRRSGKPREKSIYNPPALWVRCEGCIEPIILRDVFLRAHKIIKERRVSLSEEETLKRLRITLMKRGKLSPKLSTRPPTCSVSPLWLRRFPFPGLHLFEHERSKNS